MLYKTSFCFPSAYHLPLISPVGWLISTNTKCSMSDFIPATASLMIAGSAKYQVLKKAICKKKINKTKNTFLFCGVDVLEEMSLTSADKYQIPP